MATKKTPQEKKKARILYIEAAKRNFINKFLIHNPGYWIRGTDGRIDYKRRMQPTPPWIYTKPRENQNCHFWHKIMFDIIHQKEKVPESCHHCWKIVFMPRNIEELFATWFMQLQLGLPCKCGTEGDRENTDRLYGAYWYATSQDQGLEYHKKISQAIASQKVWRKSVFGCDLEAKLYDAGDTMQFSHGKVAVDGLPRLILKRGCTEFEQHCGASDKWQADEAQREIEFLAHDCFVQDNPNFRQADHQIANVIELWIHNAFKWGDQSYTKFTNGNRLFAPPVTYHDTGGKKNG